MKKIFFIAAIFSLILSACNKQSNTNAHTHDENCTHEHVKEHTSHYTHGENCDHNHEHDHTPAQESFTVEPESN